MSEAVEAEALYGSAMVKLSYTEVAERLKALV